MKTKQIEKQEVPLTPEMSYEEKVSLVVNEFESVLDVLINQFERKWFTVYDVEKVLSVDHQVAKQAVEMCYYSGLLDKMHGKPKYQHVLFNTNGLEGVFKSIEAMRDMHNERLFYCNVADRLINDIAQKAIEQKNSMQAEQEEKPKTTKTKSNGKKAKKPTAESGV
jgi:hypothetical protein